MMAPLGPKCHLSHLIFTAHLVQLVKQVCLVVVQSLMKVSHTFQHSVCTPEPKLQSLHQNSNQMLRKSYHNGLYFIKKLGP